MTEQPERLKISVFECSAVISAYENECQWQNALAFLQEIPEALCALLAEAPA